MLNEDQEKFLEDALTTVKAQAFHMHSTIDKNQLRQCLKESSIMVSELRTSLLTPRKYYHLYTLVFDELQYLHQYFKEEARRGRRIKDLYDAVQQASSIIPRLYLLITVGSVFIESQQVVPTEILFDLLTMVKGVQNPLRGLFLRYYLLKMVKDKLPDHGNDYEQEDSTLKDSIKFILQNLEEMNRLWIRLSLGCTGSEKIFKEKERNDLKVLIGENITRLASLQGLTVDIYQSEVLPKIITMLLDSKDVLSQEYLIECIIHAFPDDFNIPCMDFILDTCTKLQDMVNTKGLFVALMEKLSKFLDSSNNTDDTNTNTNTDNNIFTSTQKIFELLKVNIDKIINEGPQSSTDVLRLTELQVAFMKFSLKCSLVNEKSDTVNHILNSSVKILSKNKTLLSKDGINLIGKLLSAPLESMLSIFSMPNFPVLMNYLDFDSRVSLSLRIIDVLVKGRNDERLDSTEKVTILLDYIRPLLANSGDEAEGTTYQFEYEQQSVAKLIFVISSGDPFKQLEMLILFQNVFLKGGNRKKFTLPPLVNAFIMLGYEVSLGYDAKQSGIVTTNRPIRDDMINKIQINFENFNDYFNYMQKLYALISDVISVVNQNYPETAFSLLLNAATQVNAIKQERPAFEEQCHTFIMRAFQILKEGSAEQDKKLTLLTNIIGTVMPMTILSLENLQTISSNLQEVGQTFVKRSDQCAAMLSCSNMYYSDVMKDRVKVQECLNKAKRFAEYAMTNPQNLSLFVQILNKYLYYIEKGEEFMKVEVINDIIEIVKNHIITIKTEGIMNQSILSEMERYYEATKELIKARKKAGLHKILQGIEVE